MKIPSTENLLEAGAHLGHQVRRRHPKMAPYIYKSDKGVHLIDLFQTHSLLSKACDFLFEAAKNGGQIIIVGTKGQAKEVVLARSNESGALYVVERWLGGTLTNFGEIKKRLNWLKDYDVKVKTAALNNFTKKERLLMSREAEKLRKLAGGILPLTGKPAAVVVVDPHREHIAVAECFRTNVPVVAIADTNCDPRGINYLIPANDDAVKSVDLIVVALAEAIKAGYKEGGVEIEPVGVGRDRPANSGDPRVAPTETVAKGNMVNEGDLKSLNLSNRSFNALTKAGVKTVTELKNVNLDEVKGLGAKSLEEIKEKLK